MLEDLKFRRAIKRVDLRDVLAHLGIDFKEIGDELKFICPNPEHKDDTPSCTINFNPNSDKFTWFSCFGCGYSGKIVKLIADIEGVSTDRAKQIVIEFDSGTDSFRKKKRFKQRKVYSQRRVVVNLPESFVPIDVNKPNAYLKYLRGRGLTDSQILKYEWGYCTKGLWRKRVVMPVRFKGQIVNCYGRHISPSVHKDKKHKNSNMSSIERIVFPYDEIDFKKEFVWVTESLLNWFKLNRLRLDNLICIFGNQLTEWKIRLLRKFAEVRLIPDGDNGGDLLVRKTVQNISDVSKVMTVDMIRKEDANSLKLQQMKDVLKSLHVAKQIRLKRQTDYHVNL